MGPRSRIKTELPKDVIAQLNGLIAQDKLTIDELTAWLAERGHPIPRSNVHRYAQQVEELAAAARETDEIAQGFFQAIGPAEDDGMVRAQLVKMLHSLLHRGFREAMTNPKANFSPMDLHFMSRSIKDIAAASKTDVDRLINAAKLSAAKAAAEETAKKAADAASEAASKAGLSKKTADFIYKKVLGVAK